MLSSPFEKCGTLEEERRVSAQMPSSLLDRGSKLRGPSPISLVSLQLARQFKNSNVSSTFSNTSPWTSSLDDQCLSSLDIENRNLS
ncbi:hypothetical protein TNCV_2858971 [Trichonephila clavipes]|nr:hypothetical protein TNCV_2858971 [Trichonephila clavipes]